MPDYIVAITAIISIAISAGTLGWTVYRDAIQKPKFRVSAAFTSFVVHGMDPDGPYIVIEALNLGPIPNRLGLVWLRPSWFSRKVRGKTSANVMADHSHFATTQAGSRIEVGDKGVFVIPITDDCFLNHDFAEVGVSDGFGRIHWAPKRDMNKLKRRYYEKYKS